MEYIQQVHKRTLQLTQGPVRPLKPVERCIYWQQFLRRKEKRQRNYRGNLKWIDEIEASDSLPTGGIFFRMCPPSHFLQGSRGKYSRLLY